MRCRLWEPELGLRLSHRRHRENLLRLLLLLLKEGLLIWDMLLCKGRERRMEACRCSKLRALDMMTRQMMGRLCNVSEVNLLTWASWSLTEEYVLLASCISCLKRHLDLALSLLLLLLKHIILVWDAWGHISHVTNLNLLTITYELAS